VAVCPAWVSFIGVVRVQVPVARSNNSALDRATGELEVSDSPPTTRTMPSGSRVAVWKARASFIGASTVQLPFTGSSAGSKISTVFSAGPAVAGMPPVTRTRPSVSWVAVCPRRGECRSAKTLIQELEARV
jgi:hypothetical protein